MTAPDPRTEHVRLVGALRAHVGRARRRGHRRTTAPAVLVPEPPPAPPPARATPAPDPPSRTDAAPAVAAGAASRDWETLRRDVAACTACPLAATRNRTVFADGAPPARVMFVGEAPGYHEDQQGVPFVGRAGELLTDIIQKGMGLQRSEVVIANTLKCRPPENRDPTPAEKEACAPFLAEQIERVDPEVLIALGRHAAGSLLRSDAPMAKLRGTVHRPTHLGGRRVVATYHPAFLLRSPHMKKAAWEDIQLAMRELGLPVPKRG